MKNLFGYTVGIAVFLILLPSLLYLVSLGLPLPINSVLADGLGWLFVLFGIAFMIWTNIYMRKYGKGCPADVFNVPLGERTKKLLTDGPYRLSRNPMLLGTFAFYTGLALLLNSYGALCVPAIFILYMTHYVKKYEEPRLEQDFGQEYVQYKKATPFLFPRIK